MILISPQSKKLAQKNAKDYPHWNKVVEILENHKLITMQIGLSHEEDIGCRYRVGDKTLLDLEIMVQNCVTWASVDNFFPHLVNVVNKKPGVVIFGKSDPNIFGYKQNCNLLKDEKCLRQLQFKDWHSEPYSDDVWVNPETVAETINKLYVNLRKTS